MLSYTQPWNVEHISTVDDIKNPDLRCGFSTSKCYWPWSIPHPTHPRYHNFTAWGHHLLQNWFGQSISSVPVRITKTAVTTPFGLFLHMPFGYETQLKHSLTKSRMVDVYTFAVPTLMTYSSLELRFRRIKPLIVKGSERKGVISHKSRFITLKL